MTEAKGEDRVEIDYSTLVVHINGKAIDGRRVFDDQQILDSISPRQALTLGYNMGFKEGFAANDG